MHLRHPSLPHAHVPIARTTHPTAAVALGKYHPVARAARARTLIGGQLATTTVVLALAIAAALAYGGQAVTVTSAALVVELALVGGFAAARTCLHERARDVVANGDGALRVAEIAAECAQLARPVHRERLARSLERALHAAEHWHQLAIATRPPPAVRNLLGCPALAREVAQLVRDPRASVHGVALLDRLICGGYSATLYVGPADALTQELTRIHFLLTTTAHASARPSDGGSP